MAITQQIGTPGHGQNGGDSPQTEAEFELHIAIQNGASADEIQSLLSGASGERWRDAAIRNSNDDCPIHILAKSRNCNGRREILNFLLIHYELLFIHGNGQELELQAGPELNALLNLRDQKGNTVFHLAAKFKRYNLVKRLIELGADGLAKNHDGWFPIHFVAQVRVRQKEDGDRAAQLLRHLINHTPELRKYRAYESHVFTPEQLAAQSACPQVLQLLGDEGFEFLTHRGIPPLHLVIANSRINAERACEDAVKCAEYILGRRLQEQESSTSSPIVNETDRRMIEEEGAEGVEEPESSTPIVNEVNRCMTDGERVDGVNACTLSKDGRMFFSNTALHLAAHRGLPLLMKCLMQHGADPSARNSLKMTPLHALADADLDEATQKECVSVLLDASHYATGATTRGDIVMAKMIVKEAVKGPDVASQITESHLATFAQKVILRFLKEVATANPNPTYQGPTVFDLCIENGKVGLIGAVLGIMAATKEFWLDESTLTKLYSRVPVALLSSMNLYHARNLKALEGVTGDSAPGTACVDFSIITGSADATWKNRWSANLSGHLHEVVWAGKQVREQILLNPLVVSFLEWRWSRFEKLAYASAFIQFAVLLNFLVVLLLWNPADLDKMPVAHVVVTIMTIFALLPKELVQHNVSRSRRPVRRLTGYNVAQGFFCITAFTYLIIDRELKIWKRWFSVMAICCAWAVAILQLRNLPVCGKHVSILLQVTKKSFKILALFGLPTLIASATAFHLLFPKDPFASPGGVPVKAYAMMLGEFTFDEVFQSVQKFETAMQVLCLLFFTVFVFFSTVVLLNLLIAMAVQVTDEIEKNADLELRRNQLEQIRQWEALCSDIDIQASRCVRAVRGWVGTVRGCLCRGSNANRGATNVPRDNEQEMEPLSPARSDQQQQGNATV